MSAKNYELKGCEGFHNELFFIIVLVVVEAAQYFRSQVAHYMLSCQTNANLPPENFGSSPLNAREQDA